MTNQSSDAFVDIKKVSKSHIIIVNVSYEFDFPIKQVVIQNVIDGKFIDIFNKKKYK